MLRLQHLSLHLGKERQNVYTPTLGDAAFSVVKRNFVILHKFTPSRAKKSIQCPVSKNKILCISEHKFNLSQSVFFSCLLFKRVIAVDLRLTPHHLLLTFRCHNTQVSVWRLNCLRVPIPTDGLIANPSLTKSRIGGLWISSLQVGPALFEYVNPNSCLVQSPFLISYLRNANLPA